MIPRSGLDVRKTLHFDVSLVSSKHFGKKGRKVGTVMRRESGIKRTPAELKISC